jgi:hypothetical protein
MDGMMEWTWISVGRRQKSGVGTVGYGSFRVILKYLPI